MWMTEFNIPIVTASDPPRTHARLETHPAPLGNQRLCLGVSAVLICVLFLFLLILKSQRLCASATGSALPSTSPFADPAAKPYLASSPPLPAGM